MRIRTEFDRIYDSILYRRWRWQQKQKFNGKAYQIQRKRNTNVSRKRRFFKLREVQEVIGGDVEILPIEIDSVMIIHKDCELKHLTFNKRATDIAFQNNVFRCITGDVLICASEEIE